MDNLEEFEPIFRRKALAVIEQGSACPTSLPPSTGLRKIPPPAGTSIRNPVSIEGGLESQ